MIGAGIVAPDRDRLAEVQVPFTSRRLLDGSRAARRCDLRHSFGHERADRAGRERTATLRGHAQTSANLVDAAARRARGSRPRTGRSPAAATPPCRGGSSRRCARSSPAPGSPVRATSRSKNPVVRMYPVSNKPVRVASQAKPFGSGSARPMKREHLQLTPEVGAVLGDHVHEVVLREVRQRTALGSGSAKPRLSYMSQTACPSELDRELLERRPARRELGIGVGRHERRAGELDARRDRRRRSARRPRRRAPRSRCAGGPSTRARRHLARSAARRGRSRPSPRAPPRTARRDGRRRWGSGAAPAHPAPCGARSVGGTPRSRAARTSASSSRPSGSSER